MPKAKVSVLGAFVTDLTCRTDRMANWGETILGNAFKLGPGGKGSNQAVAAARLDAEVNLITKIGRDAFGEIAKRFYVQEGIGLTHVYEDPDETSATATIIIDEQTQENSIIVVQGACAHLTIDEVEAAKEDIGRANIFLTQLELPMAPTIHGIELAYAAKVPIILNPAPALAVPREVLAKVDYLTPNETEAVTLVGKKSLDQFQNIEQLADELLSFGVRNVVITLGEKGAFVKGSGVVQHVPGFHVEKVVETTGAGDAFAGGFAVALAEGQGIEAATRFGCAVAAISVTRAGTAPAMPYRKEVDELLK
jgi:ribokinase